MVSAAAQGDSFEVEVKFRLDDPAALRERLAALGFQPRGSDTQEDVYLRHPGRDFTHTHEAFRLRRHGDQNRLTYKGPKQTGPTKTREEIELDFEPGPDGWARMLALLDRLGFAPVATVRKHREEFAAPADSRPPILVVIDEVDGLGTFAEVEALAAARDDLPAAQAVVLDVAARLGLAAVETRSYLRMCLEHRRNSPGPG